MSSDVWKPKDWCAVYAILELAKIHGLGACKISSPEDLSALFRRWQESILFTKNDIDDWPGMRRELVRRVLKYVYKLQLIQICQCRFQLLTRTPRASTFQQSLKHRSLRELAQFITFKKHEGVGILFCASVKYEYHAMFFKIEQKNVLFFDTYGTSRDACWVDKWMHKWIVDVVYLVKPL
jgi:hypothetical protein